MAIGDRPPSVYAYMPPLFFEATPVTHPGPRSPGRVPCSVSSWGVITTMAICRTPLKRGHTARPVTKTKAVLTATDEPTDAPGAAADDRMDVALNVDRHDQGPGTHLPMASMTRAARMAAAAGAARQGAEDAVPGPRAGGPGDGWLHLATSRCGIATCATYQWRRM